jgi:hypothetical protein
MADKKLLDEWTKLAADFKKATEALKKAAPAAGMSAVIVKVLTIEFATVSDSLKGVENALSGNAQPAVVKACKVYDAAATSIAAKLKKEEGKYKAKNLVDALKDLSAVLKSLGVMSKKLFTQALVQQSYDQAAAEGKLDWKAVLTPDVVDKMAKVTMEMGEYRKFASAFASFASAYNLGSEAKQIPVNIWSDLIRALAKSGYIEGKIKHVTGDPKQFILAEMDKTTGKLVRDLLLKTAMEGLQPFIKHAELYLDKVIKRVKQGSKWAFWSGTGAKEAAQKEASGGIVLEGTVGKWFDEVWDFEKLTGGAKSLALWAALSELYAKKAAEYYNMFNFVGFVGPGATRDQSVFNKIEQPTFVDVMGAKAAVRAPNISWFVVDCRQDGDRWAWTGKASTPAADRAKALAKVTELYGK